MRTETDNSVGKIASKAHYLFEGIQKGFLGMGFLFVAVAVRRLNAPRTRFLDAREALNCS